MTGDTTGSLKVTVNSLFVDGIESPEAKKGDLITVSVPSRIRPNDKLYVVKDRARV